MLSKSRPPFVPFALVVALALFGTACGDDGGTTPDPDASITDDVPPVIVVTMPVDGTPAVAPDAPFRATFSEAMDPTLGTLTVQGAAGPISATSTWSEDGTELEVALGGGWPEGAIEVTVGGDFADLAGNPVGADTVVTFQVVDTVAPTIVSSAPAEGATVLPELAGVSFEISEAVRGDFSLRIEGPGDPVLAPPTLMGGSIAVAVSGLEPNGSYQVFLEGVRDLAGNRLDASALGTEGALDFDTGLDEVAPFVVESDPAEGQVDVDIALVTNVSVVFSEPMDPAAGTATLSAGGVDTPLTGSWQDGGRVLVLPVDGLLLGEAAHQIVLAGYQDLAGNAYDPTVYLLDGALDFDTGSDAFVPHVAFTSPTDGAVDVPAGFEELVIVFSEAMDTTRTTVQVEGDGQTVDLVGDWSISSTTLSVPVGARLQSGKTYRIDLSAFTDRAGTPIDTTHPYLGDGVLEWTYAAPTGETCGDALTDTEAVDTDGVLEWTLARSAVVGTEGAITCYPTDLGSAGPDALIRYRKTTASASAGGTYLHVRGNGRLSMEVFEGSCDPLGATAEADRRHCYWGAANGNDTWLDVGPGDYFIWVANGSSTFGGATVSVEEVTLPTEGESCDNPYGTTSDPAIYTPPAGTGPHTWIIPPTGISGLDRGIMPSDPAGAFSCAPGAQLGHDAVIQYDKTSATSLVTINVTPGGSFRSQPSMIASVSRGCDPADAATVEADCRTGATRSEPTSLTIDGAAGLLSTWLSVPHQQASPFFPGEVPVAFPGATVAIQEFEPGLGDSCANAITLTPGAPIAVTPDRGNRAFAPSCLGSGGITWYRFTTTDTLSVITGDGSSTVGVVDATSGDELRCGDDLFTGAAVLAPAGTDVCLAVTSNPAVSTLTIESFPYGGITGVETDLGITDPGNVGPLSLTQARWIAPKGTELFVATTAGVVHAPLAGGDWAVGAVASGLGSGGVLDASGTITSLTFSAVEGEGRLVRPVDAAGMVLPSPAAIDTPPVGNYPALRMGALIFDGTNYLMATDGGISADGTTYFYSVPAAGGAATLVGSNDFLDDVSGMASDGTFLYLTGRNGSVFAGTQGIWKLALAELSNPAAAPTLLIEIAVDMNNGAVFHDATNDVLYFRSDDRDVWAALDPDAVGGPVWAGPIWKPSGSSTIPDSNLGYDGTSLFVIDHSSGSSAVKRLD